MANQNPQLAELLSSDIWKHTNADTEEGRMTRLKFLNNHFDTHILPKIQEANPEDQVGYRNVFINQFIGVNQETAQKRLNREQVQRTSITDVVGIALGRGFSNVPLGVKQGYTAAKFGTDSKEFQTFMQAQQLGDELWQEVISDPRLSQTAITFQTFAEVAPWMIFDAALAGGLSKAPLVRVGKGTIGGAAAAGVPYDAEGKQGEKALMGGALGGALEAGASLLTKALTIGTPKPGVKELESLASQWDAPIFAHQTVPSPGSERLGSIFTTIQSSPTTNIPRQQLYLQNRAQYEALHKYLGEHVPAPSELKQAARKGIVDDKLTKLLYGRYKDRQAVVKQQYQLVDDAIAAQPNLPKMWLPNTRQEAVSLLQQYPDMFDPSVLNDARMKEWVTTLATNPAITQKMTFSQAREHLERLNDLAASAWDTFGKSGGAGKRAAALTKMVSVLDSDLDSWAASTGTDILELYRNAKSTSARLIGSIREYPKLWKAIHGELNSQNISAVFISGKSSVPDAAKYIALLPKEGRDFERWNTLSRAFEKSVIRGKTDAEHIFMPDKFVAEMNKLGKNLDVIFPPKTESGQALRGLLQYFTATADSGKRLTAKTGGYIQARMAMETVEQGTQALAAPQGESSGLGGIAKSAGVYIAGLAGLSHAGAKLLTSPYGRRLLSRFSTISPDHPEFAKLYRQIYLNSQRFLVNDIVTHWDKYDSEDSDEF